MTFISWVDHNFKHAMVESNIWGDFHAIEFESDMEAEPDRLSFNEERLRQSAGWTSESCGRLIFPSISYRTSGTTPDLVGSIGQSKMIWSKGMSLSFLRCRDIVPCQKTEKWNYREIPRITSKDLRVSEFFI
jgi:hypothetical protein